MWISIFHDFEIVSKLNKIVSKVEACVGQAALGERRPERNCWKVILFNRVAQPASVGRIF